MGAMSHSEDRTTPNDNGLLMTQKKTKTTKKTKATKTTAKKKPARTSTKKASKKRNPETTQSPERTSVAPPPLPKPKGAPSSGRASLPPPIPSKTPTQPRETGPSMRDADSTQEIDLDEVLSARLSDVPSEKDSPLKKPITEDSEALAIAIDLEDLEEETDSASTNESGIDPSKAAATNKPSHGRTADPLPGRPSILERMREFKKTPPRRAPSESLRPAPSQKSEKDVKERSFQSGPMSRPSKAPPSRLSAKPAPPPEDKIDFTFRVSTSDDPEPPEPPADESMEIDFLTLSGVIPVHEEKAPPPLKKTGETKAPPLPSGKGMPSPPPIRKPAKPPQKLVLPPRVPDRPPVDKRPNAVFEVARKIRAHQAETPVAASAIPDDEVSRARSLVAACEAELEISQDKVRSARLYFEIAQACELMLDDSAKALSHYQKSVELSPGFLPALRGARRLLMAQKSFAEAVNLLDAEIRVTGNPKHKAALHLEKGRIFEDHLNAQRKAQQSYLKAATIESGRAEILEALKQVELKSKNWSDLASVYEKSANAAKDDPVYRASLTLLRARIFDTQLKDTAKAIEAYHATLALDPTSSGALPALKRLLYKQERWKELVALLEREAGDFGETDRKSATLVQISRIYGERLGDVEKAVAAMEQALELTPENTLALKEICRLYDSLSNYPKLIDGLQRLVSIIDSPTEKLGFLHRLGQLYEQEVKDPEAAITWYESVLRLSPSYVPALRALASLYTQNLKWDALIAMHLAEAEASSNTLRRADTYVRIAEITERQLGKQEEAAGYHAQALSLQPGLESSFKALTRIYSESRQYQKLIELYEQAADRAGDVDLLFAYLFKIGALYEDAVGKPDLAVQVYLRILKRSPTHLGAIHALQRAADSAGAYREQVDALKRETDQTKDKTRIIGLLQRAAEVLDEKVGDTESALVYYNRVLDLDPDYAPTLAGLGRLYHRTGRWEELLRIYEQELKIAEQNDARVALLTKMGDLAVQQLGSISSAVKYYERAIEVDPKYVPALQALHLLLRQKGDFDTLVKVMETELSGTDDAEARARLACEIADIQEVRRQDPSHAADAYAQALTAIPNYKPAMEGLSRVNAALGRWQALATQLISEAEQSLDDRHAINTLLQAGAVYSDYLNDSPRAISAFEKILERQPMHVGALLSLAPLYRETSAWQYLGETYVRLVGTLKDEGEQVAVYRELERVLTQHNPQMDLNPREVLLGVVALDPANLSALTALEQWAMSSKDYALLAEVDAHMVQAMDDPRVAAIYLSRLGQSIEPAAESLAMEACSTALTLDAGSLSAIRVLKRLAEKTASIKGMAQALQREADWTENGDAAAELLIRSANLHLERLSDLEGAVAALSTALERCPEHEGAAKRLTEILLQAQQVDLLIEILSRTANMATDNKRKAALLRSLSSLYADSKGDLSGAISAVSRMRKAQPDHVPTMMRLIELYKLNKQWEEAANLLEKVIQLRPEGDDLTEAYIDLARISEQQLRNPTRALQHVEALLKVDRKNVEALTMQCDLQFKSGKLDAANQAAERLLQSSDDPQVRTMALYCLGRIKLKKGTKKQAATVLREAIALTGPGTPAAEEYRRLLGNEESWDHYADALREYQHQIQGVPTKRDNLALTIRELARVQHEGRGSAADAIATLKEGLEELGDHPVLRADLGICLAATGLHKEAVRMFLGLLAENPTHVDTWRALASTFKLQGQEAAYRNSLAALVVLGEATPEEKQDAESRLARPSVVRAGSFSPSTLQAISPNVPGEGDMTRLLGTMKDALSKLYPPDFQEFALSRSDALSANHPLRMLADNLSTAFDVNNYDIYLNNSGRDAPLVELTQPISILVPGRIAKLPAASQAFVLARAFAYIARGHQAILRLGPNEMVRILSAATFKFSGGYGRFDHASLESLNKRMLKATSWMSRKTVEEAASRLVSEGKVDFDQILTGIEVAATRASAILSNSLPHAVREIQQMDTGLAHLSGNDLAARSPLVLDLLAFWPTVQAQKLRNKAGLQ